MKAVFSVGGQVPWSRVLREHRTALLPLAVVLVINLIVLVAVVLPMSQRMEANEQRAETAERQRIIAEAEFKRAETLERAQAQATTDLETFYAQVLPSSVAEARRVLFVGLRQTAREHGVAYQSGGTDEEEIRESNLLRMTMQVQLEGEYDAIRSFIYDLETSSDFVVIDNVRLAAGQEPNAPLTVTLDVSTYYRSSQPSAIRTGGDGR